MVRAAHETVGAVPVGRARRRAPGRRRELLIAATSARIGHARPRDEIAGALAELVLTDTAVSEIAHRVGLSSRQVHRRCLDGFGLTPSLLRRIARVHRAARHTAGATRPPLAQLATDTGFTDQAHFCREVRALSGETPRHAFRSARPIHAIPQRPTGPTVPAVTQWDDITTAIAVALGGDRAQGRHDLDTCWAGTAETDHPQRCVLAHYLADLQDDLATEVAWDEHALAAFTHVHEADLAAVGIPDAASLAPSLHLNLGDGYLRQGRTAPARDQLTAALAALDALPDDGYGAMIRRGLTSLHERLADQP